MYKESAKALVVSEPIVGVAEYGSNIAEFGRWRALAPSHNRNNIPYNIIKQSNYSVLSLKLLYFIKVKVIIGSG